MNEHMPQESPDAAASASELQEHKLGEVEVGRAPGADESRIQKVCLDCASFLLTPVFWVCESKFGGFIWRAFVLGCGFRVAVTILCIIYLILFGSANLDKLSAGVRLIGGVLGMLMVFDVSLLAGKNHALYDLISDPDLGYEPRPHLYITLPLCILAGTLFIGALLVGARALFAMWRSRIRKSR